MAPELIDRLDQVLQSEARWFAIRKGRNKQCRLCPLHKGAQSVCTQGDGNPTAPIMLIGEAPGQREDDLEKPFQGPAGALLDKVLDEMGMDRGQVFIDNVVRCRPPKNRRPEPEEVDACRPYLVHVLQVVKPRVVVAMGATALYGLTGRTGITKLRGTRIWSKFGFLVVPAFHPAYCLRNRSTIWTLSEDIGLAVRSLGLYDYFKEIREHRSGP